MSESSDRDEPRGRGPDLARDRLNEKVGAAVIPAHYAAVMSSVTEARDRAQRAYVIASAIAAALVTAGAFAEIGSRPVLVRVAGLAALAAWLLAASMFMSTVGATIEPKGAQEFTDEDAFVKSLLDDNREARRSVNERHAKARAATFAAIGLTVAALALGLFGASSTESSARLSLTPTGAASVARVCPELSAEFDGLVSVDSLDAQLIEVRPSSHSCDGATRLAIPRSEVRALALDG